MKSLVSAYYLNGIIIIIIWFKHQYLEKIFPIKSVTHHKHLNSDINNGMVW